MTIYAKANSNTENMKSYLQSSDGGGFGSMVIYPDTFEIELVGAEDKLHSTRTVDPEDNATKINFPIAFYLPYIGFQYITVPIVRYRRFI